MHTIASRKTGLSTKSPIFRIKRIELLSYSINNNDNNIIIIIIIIIMMIIIIIMIIIVTSAPIGAIEV